MKIEQLKRLRDLNIELLETVIQTWFAIKEHSEEHGIPLPTEDKFSYLLQRVRNLCEEINIEIALPPNFQHRFRTPKDSTEPIKTLHIKYFYNGEYPRNRIEEEFKRWLKLVEDYVDKLKSETRMQKGHASDCRSA